MSKEKTNERCRLRHWKNKGKENERSRLYYEKNKKKLMQREDGRRKRQKRLKREEDRQQEEAKQEEAKQKEANQNAAAMDGSPQLDGVRCWGGSTPIAESSTFWDWPQRRMKSFDTRRRRDPKNTGGGWKASTHVEGDGTGLGVGCCSGGVAVP